MDYIFICLICLFILFITLYYLYNTYIPGNIYMTYYDKSKIPEKVYKCLDKYASGYKIHIYDDNECMTFLETHFVDSVCARFKSLKKGAHKADLFRYCILYIHGGIYMDIKTELIKPLEDIIVNRYKYTYSVLSIVNGTVYQGIIATYKNNPIFLSLINDIVNIKDDDLEENYGILTKHFYDILKNISIDNKIIRNVPFKTTNGDEYYLFNELCTRDKVNDCYDGLDRYGYCCHIYDNDEKIIKTRYADFPW